LVCARWAKDLEDQLGPVEHAPLQLALHVALLRRGQRVVEHHEGGVQRFGRRADLGHLAAAGVELRIGSRALAADHAVAAHACALDQAHDFLDALVVGVVAEIQAYDDRCLRVGSLRRGFLRVFLQTATRRPCRLPG
jgi:hypothetical protein